MDGRKIAASYAVIFATFILFQEIANSYAQVTFSRDWNAGKRSVSECSQMSIKSAAAICQMLLGELKSLATCEMRSLLSTRVSEEVDNPPDVFSSRTG
uniref:Neuropeptide n=1 Tax=Nezara viridula TaxID=85310 RepID=A0A3S8RK72_NEZVI|nr:neuropeptide precursor [Nezara viridula]